VVLGWLWGRSKMSGRTMSYEFDSLDANEKAALKGALIRCRALVGRIESALCNEKPEHFFDELTLADFYASLERATDILGQKGRQSAPAVKGSQKQSRKRHR
jgi:hypothetical protein